MLKKPIITLIAVMIVVYIAANIIGVPMDCMPIIGDYPLPEQIVRSLFRVRCVTF